MIPEDLVLYRALYQRGKNQPGYPGPTAGHRVDRPAMTPEPDNRTREASGNDAILGVAGMVKSASGRRARTLAVSAASA